jgi:hypothetical protein
VGAVGREVAARAGAVCREAVARVVFLAPTAISISETVGLRRLFSRRTRSQFILGNDLSLQKRVFLSIGAAKPLPKRSAQGIPRV